MGVLRSSAKKKTPSASSQSGTTDRPVSPVWSADSSAVTNSSEHRAAVADAVRPLLNDLAQAKNTGGDRATKALRKLFQLSENPLDQATRIEMVKVCKGKLVFTLLAFLNRCEKGSSTQSLALLVLNNISMPPENKRWIALDCGAAHILSRILCDNPACHLVAIVLVNLTFVDAELRRELVNPSSGIQLMESLSFVLRVASLTQQEYELRQPLIENDPELPREPAELLKGLLAEDRRKTMYPSEFVSPVSDLAPESAPQLFPDTVRWSLCAIKNLTRPSRDTSAADTLIRCEIFPHILKVITLPHVERHQKAAMDQDDIVQRGDGSSTGDSGDDTPEPMDPSVTTEDWNGSPFNWDCHTPQDAALFIVINLAIVPSARRYLREMNSIEILSSIVEYSLFCNSQSIPGDEATLHFQRLKARMALAFLVGSEGHFGQPIARKTTNSIKVEVDESVIVIGRMEATEFVELLANTLHRRSKEGRGGYSAATFNVKCVLFAVRCLLTNYLNRVGFAMTEGIRLNTLLLKVLAIHSFRHGTLVDAEAAEHACFSLYLLSGFGFTRPFLPDCLGSSSDFSKGLATKILTAYTDQPNVTAAGKHAGKQVLQRLKYLIFRGEARDMANEFGESPFESDFLIDEDIVESTKMVLVGPLKPGAKPRPDIFTRPILRTVALSKGNTRGPWDNHASVDNFPSALTAVEELSFASTKVRHADFIDDIQIANNISNSANGEKTESYNYMWSWQDTAGEIQRNLEKQRSVDSFLSFKNSGMREDPLLCAALPSLCGADTTM